MIHKMFVIYDSQAKAYMQPWFLTQNGMAQRAFSDCVNDADHNFARHPEDYTLFTIGEYDDQTATLQCHAPHTMGNGIQYILTKPTDPQIDFLQTDLEEGKGLPLELPDNFHEKDYQNSLKKLDGDDK